MGPVAISGRDVPFLFSGREAVARRKAIAVCAGPCRLGVTAKILWSRNKAIKRRAAEIGSRIYEANRRRRHLKVRFSVASPRRITF